ncbi:hypothetical protein Q6272_26600, partial [Klebsiella pneumoniae]
SVHHIWCPLSSQEFQDLPDGAETTLTSYTSEIKIHFAQKIERQHLIVETKSNPIDLDNEEDAKITSGNDYFIAHLKTRELTLRNIYTLKI